MEFDRSAVHVFREKRTSPATAVGVSAREIGRAQARAGRSASLRAYRVHRSLDAQRVITVETWSDRASFHADADAREPGAAAYRWLATDGVTDGKRDEGVIVIDLFAVFRPIAPLVAAFNIRNGRSFNQAPGCLGTTVLRGIGSGRIATYARWRSVGDFAAAFSEVTGRAVTDTDGVNAAAARMTFGLIRTDYHAHDLIEAWEAA